MSEQKNSSEPVDRVLEKLRREFPVTEDPYGMATTCTGGELLSVTGTVEINHGSGWVTASVGDCLENGSKLRTGKDSRAEISIPDGTVLRVRQYSALIYVNPDVTIDVYYNLLFNGSNHFGRGLTGSVRG